MYFITLPFFWFVKFTFYINDVLLFKCPFPGQKVNISLLFIFRLNSLGKYFLSAYNSSWVEMASPLGFGCRKRLFPPKIRRVDVNLLNKQLRIVEMGWSSRFCFGRRAEESFPWQNMKFKNVTQGFELPKKDVSIGRWTWAFELGFWTWVLNFGFWTWVLNFGFELGLLNLGFELLS